MSEQIRVNLTKNKEGDLKLKVFLTNFSDIELAVWAAFTLN